LCIRSFLAIASLLTSCIRIGETAAINNCSKVLASEPYNLNGHDTLKAYEQLSLYTTAEPCPMVSPRILQPVVFVSVVYPMLTEFSALQPYDGVASKK
jgi:hypothetical protein